MAASAIGRWVVSLRRKKMRMQTKGLRDRVRIGEIPWCGVLQDTKRLRRPPRGLLMWKVLADIRS